MHSISKEYLNLSKYIENFNSALPFPHLILDNFLNKNFYNEISNNLNQMGIGEKFNSDVEKNKWISRNSKLPDKIREVISDLNSTHWINELTKLSNIGQLFGTRVGN